MRKQKVAFFAIILLMLFSVNSCGQSKSKYKISWEADSTGKTVSWNVYIEQRTTSTGFVLQPGSNRYNTDLNQFISIKNIVGTTTEVIVELNNDGNWLMVGVEAMSSSGIYSDFGVMSTPYKKGEAPPIPAGITIQRLP